MAYEAAQSAQDIEYAKIEEALRYRPGDAD